MLARKRLENGALRALECPLRGGATPRAGRAPGLAENFDRPTEIIPVRLGASRPEKKKRHGAIDGYEARAFAERARLDALGARLFIGADDETARAAHGAIAVGNALVNARGARDEP